MRGNVYIIGLDPENMPYTDADNLASGSGTASEAEWFQNSDREQAEKAAEFLVKTLGGKYEPLSKYEGIVGRAKFPKNVKELYFEKRYEKLKDLVSKMTLTKFASGDVYELRSTIEETYGDMVWTDGEDFLLTLDSWVRSIRAGKWYYFGDNVIAAH